MPKRPLSASDESLAQRESWYLEARKRGEQGWFVSLPVVDPVPGFPVTDCVARDRPSTPAYHILNANRRDEGHCLLKITLAGEGRFRDARGEYRIMPGQAFICLANDPATSYYYPPDGTQPWDLLWMQFSGEAARTLVAALVARHGPVYTLGLDHALLRRLLSFKRLRRTMSLLTPTEAWQLIATALEALSASARAGAPASDDGLVERAVALIETDLASGIGVSELAARLAVSREHLTRQFVVRLGCPLQRYLRRERVRQACHLLRATDLPLKAVAQRCGLGSPEILIRSFAAELGTTPGKYRRLAESR